MNRRGFVAWALPCAALAAACALAGLASAAGAAQELKLAPAVKTFKGDYDEMVRRRVIRVLTVSSKTFFFIDRGTPRGLVHETMRAFEEDINRSIKAKTLRVTIVYVPVSRAQLLPALREGRGDIAAANLTITPARAALVDFTRPVATGVREVVVSAPDAPPVASAEELSGREVFVRPSSSYHESLLALNRTLQAKGKAPVKIVPAPEVLEDEDLIEMANAGLVSYLVVDSHKAGVWQSVFPKVRWNMEAAVHEGGEIAWAVRKENPQLKEQLDAFIARQAGKADVASVALKRYLAAGRHVKSATQGEDLKRFQDVVALFRKYGDRYKLDWLLVAAQGYQESGLNQAAKSPVGAVGVMQLMPATGKDMAVGDISQLEPNIHAGVKYIRFMVDQYYANEPMDELNKGLFAFASYNAGPGRIRQMRAEAARRGLDPNVWFDNVERVTAEKIGRETVGYVSNIYKYYIAYSLVQGEYQQRMEARKSLAGSVKATRP